jgi:hypothetical protein
VRSGMARVICIAFAEAVCFIALGTKSSLREMQTIIYTMDGSGLGCWWHMDRVDYSPQSDRPTVNSLNLDASAGYNAGPASQQSGRMGTGTRFRDRLRNRRIRSNQSNFRALHYLPAVTSGSDVLNSGDTHTR